MNKTQRAKETALDRIMASHREWEKRTLCDLRIAGYNFTTVGEAHRYVRARHTVRAMTDEQLVETFANLTKNARATA